jgi:hypothetical protein
MAPYGVVSQLLALVQWRAWAHACATTAMIELRLLQVTECPARTPDCPGPDSWLLTDWLWTWLKLAITRWPLANLGCSSKTLTPGPLPVWYFNLKQFVGGGEAGAGPEEAGSWPVAPPTSTSSLRRWRDIRKTGDIIGLWYQVISIS